MNLINRVLIIVILLFQVEIFPQWWEDLSKNNYKTESNDDEDDDEDDLEKDKIFPFFSFPFEQIVNFKNILSLNVIDFFDLSERINTELKKSLFLESDEYKDLKIKLLEHQSNALNAVYQITLDSEKFGLSDYVLQDESFNIRIGRDYIPTSGEIPEMETYYDSEDETRYLIPKHPTEIRGLSFSELPISLFKYVIPMTTEDKSEKSIKKTINIYDYNIPIKMPKNEALKIEENKDRYLVSINFFITGITNAAFTYLTSDGYRTRTNELITTKIINYYLKEKETNEIIFNHIVNSNAALSEIKKIISEFNKLTNFDLQKQKIESIYYIDPNYPSYKKGKELIAKKILQTLDYKYTTNDFEGYVQLYLEQFNFIHQFYSNEQFSEYIRLYNISRVILEYENGKALYVKAQTLYNNRNILSGIHYFENAKKDTIEQLKNYGDTRYNYGDYKDAIDYYLLYQKLSENNNLIDEKLKSAQLKYDLFLKEEKRKHDLFLKNEEIRKKRENKIEMRKIGLSHSGFVLGVNYFLPLGEDFKKYINRHHGYNVKLVLGNHFINGYGSFDYHQPVINYKKFVYSTYDSFNAYVLKTQLGLRIHYPIAKFFDPYIGIGLLFHYYVEEYQMPQSDYKDPPKDMEAYFDKDYNNYSYEFFNVNYVLSGGIKAHLLTLSKFELGIVASGEFYNVKIGEKKIPFGGYNLSLGVCLGWKRK